MGSLQTSEQTQHKPLPLFHDLSRAIADIRAFGDISTKVDGWLAEKHRYNPTTPDQHGWIAVSLAIPPWRCGLHRRSCAFEPAPATSGLSVPVLVAGQVHGARQRSEGQRRSSQQRVICAT